MPVATSATSRQKKRMDAQDDSERQITWGKRGGKIEIYG
jgi:hypothetical protein